MAWQAWKVQIDNMKQHVEYESINNVNIGMNNVKDKLQPTTLTNNLSRMIVLFEDIITKLNIINVQTEPSLSEEEKLQLLSKHCSYSTEIFGLHIRWSYRLASVE